ncbi:PBP1A family penicillin-binding protein, partial [Candidatus Uhrbacteria bacterium]|nr:PBP1A family penicillin-binding protein [Candidatus Uhrbacteria bacterium]
MNLSRHRGHSSSSRRTPLAYSPRRRNGNGAVASLASFFKLLFPVVVAVGLLLRALVAPIIRLVLSRGAKRIWPSVFIGGFSVAAITVLIIYATLPDPTMIAQRTVPQSTKIYDRTGKTILYDIHDQLKRTEIELDAIPVYAKQATLIAEDKDFYSHSGFDIKGIIRSVIKDVFTLSKAQGASTITQQLVKNALLTNQKTWTRKIRELLLAYKIEKKFTKDQILKMYFNEIPYGRLAYGIEAATQTYFGKHARDLTLAQAAILAALPQAPSYYSPYGSHKDILIARSQYILNQMRAAGHITDEQLKQALAEQLVFAPSRETIIAPHFVFYVRDLLEQEFGPDAVEQGGLIVTTTLDVDKQRIAEEAVGHGEAKLKQYNASNAALVSLDPKTGQILAMVGSRDFFDDSIDGKVNVALRPRQPGSSFKPIVYAAAFEKGYTPDTLLYDVITTFKNIPQDYTPQNYTGKTYGLVTMRQALAGSLNIPAVKTLYLTGVPRVLDFAERLGYSTLKDRSRFSLSLVLGGGEVTLLEHTAAFSVFSQEGVYHPAQAILKVEDSRGTVLKQFRDQPRQVVEPEITRQLTSILTDNAARAYIFGANNLLTLPDRPVAAKTGTTNDNRDAWLEGFTPSLTTGVWVGNNNNKEMNNGADGSVVAAPIWNEYMRRALEGTVVEQFTPPQPIAVDKPVLKGERPGATTVNIDKASGKLATDRTPASFVEERKYYPLHSILYWLNKDGPRGAVPADPAQDPQYQNWENAVLEWTKAQTPPIEGTNPPTEFDDVHIPANTPTVRVQGVSDGQILNSLSLSLSIEAVAPRGVRRIDILVDNKLVKSVIDAALVPSPWTGTVLLDAAGALSSGGHT